MSLDGKRRKDARYRLGYLARVIDIGDGIACLGEQIDG